MAAAPATDANILLRTEGKPESLLGAFRSQVHDLDPNLPILESDNLANLLLSSLFAYRAAATLAALLGGIGLLLASIGIFGVLSYSVAQRRQEFGIRLALGAGREDILQLVVRHGFLLAVAGITVGLIASIALTRLMASLLYKVGTHDVTTFALTSVVMLAIALAASYIPARRATKVSPIEALK